MAHAIGIDVGTTNVKVVLVGSQGEIVASTTRALETCRSPDGNVAEQDPEAIWRAVKGGITEVTATSAAAAADVVTLGCCSQYSSIVPVGADAAPVAPMLLWQDRRGAEECARLLHPEGVRETWMRRQGFPPAVEGLSLSHVLYLQNERVDIHARTAAYLEPMDYVNARLTGRIAANQCTMFMTQVCDNRRLGGSEYDDELIELVGIDRSRLPPLDALDAPAGRLRPELAAELGLPECVVVNSGMNDSHADVLATGALAPGRAGLAIGTTSVLVDVVDGFRVDLEHEVLSMPSPFGRYMVWAEAGVGGRALEFLLQSIVHGVDELGDHRATELFTGVEAAIDAAPAGSNGLLFLPWLTGSLAPQVEPSARGAFVNMRLETSRRDLVRAAAEGIGHNVRWLLPVVEAFTRNEIADVAFLGGAARSNAWSQVLADVLQRPVLQVSHPDRAVARAVALFALHRHGDLTAGDLGALTNDGRRYEPSDEHGPLYDAMHDAFRAAFAGLRPVFAALNR